MERLWFLPFERIIDDVFLPCLHEMGDGWAQGRYSITQEHFMSAFLRDQLGGMLRQLGGGPEHGHTVVCSSIEGDSHELGLLAVAIKLALRGWRVENLGADLPVVELARHVRASESVRLVIVAVTVKRPEAELRRVLNALRALIPSEISVVAGGPGVSVLHGPSHDSALDGVHVYERFEDMARVLAGRYIDRLEKHEGEWRIAIRRATVEVAMEGKAILPNGNCIVGSGYLRGSRDRTDPSYWRPLTCDGGERWE